MFYILTHICNNENLEPKTFENRQDAISEMIHDVSETAKMIFQSDWMHEDEDDPNHDRKIFNYLHEKGCIKQANEFQVIMLDGCDVFEIFPADYYVLR